MSLNQKKTRKTLTAKQYIEGILSSDITVLSQAITLVESTLEEHIGISLEIMDRCIREAGNSERIGITGVPGVGKSSFIESLGMYLVDEMERKVAVLAVDPTSSISRGSIMGDKVRMEKLSRKPQAYIRPSPTSGSLGGVARKTREAIFLCEAAGFDTIIVETVGVGQSETAVHSMVDFFLLLVLAGAGDSLQGIKRGVVEMADTLAITKADGSNKDNARVAQKEYRSAIKLFPAKDSGWTPEVLTCSALTGEGIEDVWGMISRYFSHVRDNGYLRSNRQRQAKYWMHETISDSLSKNFYSSPGIRSVIDEVEKDVVEGRTSSLTAARKLLDIYLGR